MKEKLAGDINGIIEYLYDSENGFKESAHLIENEKLKMLFNDLCQQRATFATELRQLVETLGCKPATSGSIIAAAHRAFLDLKSLITKGDTQAVCKEVNRGETALLEHYNKTLEVNISESVQQVLQKQKNIVKQNLERIRSLADI